MNHLSVRRFLLVSLLIIAVALVSACGAKEENNNVTGGPGTDTTEQNTGSSNTEPDTTPEPNTDEDPGEPAMTKETIKVYYPDDQLMELSEQTAEIEFADESKKAEAAFQALRKDGSNGEVSLWKEIELLSAKVEEGGAVVLDVHVPDEARLGAPGEVLALEAIQKTMFQFDSFQSLDILVDGKQVESLMGHDTLEHPYKK